MGAWLFGSGLLWWQALADWMVETWEAEATRRPLWLAVAFGAGTATYFLLPTEPPALVAVAVAGPSIMMLFTGARPAWRWFALLVLLFTLSSGAGQWRVATVEAPQLSRATKRFEAEACIRAITPRATFTQLEVADWSAEAPLPKGLAAQLRWRSAPPNLRPGERIAVSVRLFPVSRAVYPGSYDPKRIAYFKGVGAEGWIGKTTQRLGRCREPTPLEQARRWLRDRLLATDAAGAGGVLVGVSTGWRGDIPRPDVNAMRDAGLGHLLAISGLHVGLVVGLVLVSMRALLALIPPVALRFPIKKWAAVAGLLAGLVYLAFSGGSVPTQRAMIMLGLVLIALLLDRVELSMRPIAWAAVIVLAASPESILSPSFHLSFAAVIGLVAVFETWRRYKNRRGRRPDTLPWAVRYLAGVSATTLIATFATMPFAAFHFHRIALMSLAANLVAIPVFAFWVIPALLIGVLMLPFGLEGVAWGIAAKGTGVILTIAHNLTGWDGAVARIGVMPYWGVGLMAAGGLWWAIWQRRWRWAGAGIAACGLIAPITAYPPDLIYDERYMAISARNGSYWVQGRQGFVSDMWMREVAGNPLPWPTGRVDGASGTILACDAQACRYETPDGTIAIVEDPAVGSDCADATYGISRWPVPGCSAFSRYGESRIVYLENGGTSIASNKDGKRPWQSP